MHANKCSIWIEFLHHTIHISAASSRPAGTEGQPGPKASSQPKGAPPQLCGCNTPSTPQERVTEPKRQETGRKGEKSASAGSRRDPRLGEAALPGGVQGPVGAGLHLPTPPVSRSPQKKRCGFTWAFPPFSSSHNQFSDWNKSRAWL